MTKSPSTPGLIAPEGNSGHPRTLPGPDGIFLGKASLRRAIDPYLIYYHRERDHQAIGGQLIEPDASVGQHAGEISCCERFGGMLKYYYRQAA